MQTQWTLHSLTPPWTHGMDNNVSAGTGWHFSSCEENFWTWFGLKDLPCQPWRWRQRNSGASQMTMTSMAATSKCWTSQRYFSCSITPPNHQCRGEWADVCRRCEKPVRNIWPGLMVTVTLKESCPGQGDMYRIIGQENPQKGCGPSKTEARLGEVWSHVTDNRL